jgi:histidine ammonia-lyase
MGMTSAIKSRQIIENSWTIVAIEMIAAAQAFDFRQPTKPSKGCQAAYEVVRRHVQKLEEDRPTYNDINRLTQVLRRGEVLQVVEGVVGKLK